MNTLLSLILLFIMLQHFNDKKEWAILVLKKKKKKKDLEMFMLKI